MLSVWRFAPLRAHRWPFESSLGARGLVWAETMSHRTGAFSVFVVERSGLDALRRKGLAGTLHRLGAGARK